jgi:hypothetical protein
MEPLTAAFNVECVLARQTTKVGLLAFSIESDHANAASQIMGLDTQLEFFDLLKKPISYLIRHLVSLSKNQIFFNIGIKILPFAINDIFVYVFFLLFLDFVNYQVLEAEFKLLNHLLWATFCIWFTMLVIN